jgi:pyruvate/2-oxoglutarate dehydrogenase complex dihydrolipoamide acyltransferase (E2) component
MAHRLVVTLTVATLLAVLAAGCGSASTSTSTTTPHTAVTSAAAAPTTTATTATSPAPAIPAGFARYQAKGFSFVAPAGLKPAPDSAVAGLPRGATAATLTPAGKQAVRTNTQIIEGTNPRLRTNVDLDQVATSLESADANDPALGHVKTSVSTMTVDGAEQVRVVTESYIGPDGPHAKTLFHRTWLMVLPKPGLLLDLVVINEPQHGGKLNPATVLDSFRLGS